MQWQLTQPIESALSNFNDQDEDLDRGDKPAGYLLQFNSQTEVLKAYPIIKPSFKYIIGRADMCAIVIDHVSVSNEHAEIEVEDGILWVVDKNSTNLTRIGDKMHSADAQNKACKPGRAHQVNSKQFLTLGDVQLRYYHAADYEALDKTVFKWLTAFEQSYDTKNYEEKWPSSEVKDLSGAGKKAVPGGLTSSRDQDPHQKDRADTLVTEGDFREDSIDLTDDEVDDLVNKISKTELSATLRYDPNEDIKLDSKLDLPATVPYNSDEEEKKLDLPATVLFDSDVGSGLELPHQTGEELVGTLKYDPAASDELNNVKLSESTQDFALSVGITESSHNNLEAQELGSSARDEWQPAKKWPVTTETLVFDPSMTQAFKLSVDMIDDPCSLADACQEDCGFSNPMVPQQDGEESKFNTKPCNTLIKEKSSMKSEAEGKTVQMEDCPKSSPEFGARMVAGEKSTSLLPHKKQCLVQAATDDDSTTCDEEEKVKPIKTENDEALEEVIQTKLDFEPRVSAPDKDCDTSDKALCQEVDVKDDGREHEPSDQLKLIARSNSAVQSALSKQSVLWKPQEKLAEKMKRNKTQSDDGCVSALTDGESKFVETTQLEGVKNAYQLPASQCSVLVSQPSQLQIVTSQRGNISPTKLDFSSQNNKLLIFENESERSLTKKGARVGKEHEPLVRCKRKPDTDPTESLARNKFRKLSSTIRRKKHTSSMEKYDSPEFEVKAENKKKRKQSLPIEASTFPIKKPRIWTLSEPVSRSAPIRSPRKAAKKSIYLLRTGYTNSKENKELRKIGAIILNSVVPKLTHLCIDKFRTTEKLLCGLAYCDYLVSDLWPTACSVRENFDIDEAEYFIKPDKKLHKTEKELGFNLTEVIRRRNRRITKVFNGLKLLKTQVVNPAFENMFVAHGGKLAKSSGLRPCPQLIILGLDDEDQQAQTFLSKHYKVRNPSWVKASIFRQELPKESEFLIECRT